MWKEPDVILKDMSKPKHFGKKLKHVLYCFGFMELYGEISKII